MIRMSRCERPVPAESDLTSPLSHGTSMMFMMPIPAHEQEMAAMPPRRSSRPPVNCYRVQDTFLREDREIVLSDGRAMTGLGICAPFRSVWDGLEVHRLMKRSRRCFPPAL